MSIIDNNNFDSTKYWRERYKGGGNSGRGSYGKQAQFKANFLNDFVRKNKIRSVFEIGCGDGSQIEMFDFPKYTGEDVSRIAIKSCKRIFKKDKTKAFRLITGSNESKICKKLYDMSVSLDVIFHLVEDGKFESYMRKLFESATRYVIIYSSNTNMNWFFQKKHVRHRKFTDFVEIYHPNWNLQKIVAYSGLGLRNLGDRRARFFVYKRKGLTSEDG